MQITLINVTQIYIHSVQWTVNYSWSLFAHHSNKIMHHLYNIQTEFTVWYNAWQRHKHAPCQDACSVLTVHVSTNIFITETNNYTKRLLQSHTDHYLTPGLWTGKKLTTEELNRSIACHRTTQMKNKSHMLVCKTHHSTVLGYISKGQFPIEPDMFSHGTKKDFATVLDTYWRKVVFITPPTIWSWKRTIVSAEYVAG